MKLQIRRIKAPAIPGGYAFALCDDDGQSLPCQQRCVVDTSINGGSVTVELFIDGKDVRLGSDVD